MKFNGLKSVDLSVDYSENQDVYAGFDREKLYNADSQNIYISSTTDTEKQDHFSIINDIKDNYSQIFSVSQISGIINSNPAPTNIMEDSILVTPSTAGVTVGENAFLITGTWGHEYLTSQDSSGYYFADVEKHPTNSGAGDYLLCWAAAASNLLQWGGWANDVDVSISTEQDVLDYYAAHWTDEGGFTTVGWEWWLTGNEPSWYADNENYSDSSHVDVAGGGFYSTAYPDSNSTASVIETAERYDGVNFKFENYWDFMVEHMEAGYGVYLGLSFGTNMGHAITAWGYEETDGVKYLYYSDSDDNMDPTGGAAAPNYLKRTRLTLDTDYYYDLPGGIYVLNDYSYYRTELDQVSAIRQYDSDMVTVGSETFTDARQITVSTDGEARRGNVDVEGDTDYYTFTTTSTGYVNIIVSALTNADVDFYVYDGSSADDLIATISGSNTSYGFNAAVGTYYIMVEGVSLRTGGNVKDNTYVISFGADSDLPTTPGSLTQTVTGDDLSLDWADSSDTSGIKNYQVQISTSETFETTVEDKTFTNSEGTFLDLADGTYFWRVRAQDNAEKQGAWSVANTFTVDTTAPDAPLNLDKADLLEDVAGYDYLTWDASSDDNGIKKYIVEYADNSSLSGSTTVEVTDNKIAISQMPGILIYHWRVKAVDNYGNISAWSDIKESDVPDKIDPSVPVGLRRIVGDFAWDAATDDRSGVASYTIEYSENADFSDSGTKTGITTNSIAVSDLGVTATNYYWRVKTVDIADNESDWSAAQVYTKADSSGEKTLNAPSADYDNFGHSVAISGDNMVAGAYGDDNKAYIYRWNGSSHDNYDLTAGGDVSPDSVFISGDNVVVGARSDNSKGTDAGGVYVYSWNGSSYDEYKLTAFDSAGYDCLGYSVSISGDNIAAGACGDDDSGINSGSAYVFRKYRTFYEEYKLSASDGSRYDAFGSSVSISGDRVFVGAYQDDDKGTDSGSVYVYDWNDTYYDETNKLTASDGAAGDYFGYSLSGDGNNVVVGAYMDDVNDTDAGSAYVYRWNETTSSYDEYKLTASDGSGGDYFGYSVSISGDYVAVGACNDDDSGIDSGSAYVYEWDGSAYNEITKIVASSGAGGDNFASSVSISGNKLMVGTASGEAYVYVLDFTPPSDVTSMVVDNAGSSSVDLNWADSTDNVGVTGYIVEYADNASFAGALSSTVTESEVTFSGLDAGSTYHWRVKAQDAAGNESAWSTGTFTTTVVAPPAAATGMTLKAASYYSAQLDWSDSAGSAEYVVEYSNSESFNAASSITVSGSELAIGNLNQGSKYYWRVKAADAVGNESDWSTTGTFKTSGIFSTVPANFDGNGRGDILLTDGFTVGYYADGLSDQWQSLSTYTPGWYVVGVADFDANGKSDILFTNGTKVGYYADGLSSNWFSSGGLDAGWNFAGIGDFDGNGKDDILITDGFTVGYYADGSTQWHSLSTYTPGWYVAGVADFDNNGKSDILFTNGTKMGFYADGLSSKWFSSGSLDDGWSVAGIGDFDGNGKDDILISNGTQVDYYVDGLWTKRQELGNCASGWDITGVVDFDDNGTDDILLSNGSQIGYYTEGFGSGLVLGGEVSSGWSLAGVGDFDASGKGDILLTDGFTVGYYADGSDQWQSLSTYTPGWYVVGVGDFDANGKSDILFTNGTKVGYYADGLSTKWFSSGGLDAGWSVAGIGDFDGNGRDDILTTDGFTVGYYADGSTQWHSLSTYTPGWYVAGVADFDNNGKSDILFTNGTKMGFYADGLSSKWFSSGSLDDGWSVAGIGDFDGNGRDDILLTDGEQVGYYADGLAAGWQSLDSCPAGWEIADVADFDGNGKSDILFSNGTQVGYYADGFGSGWTKLGDIDSGWDIVVA